MIRANYKLELYKFDEESLSPYAVDISDCVSLSETSGIETRRDTFKFNFLNRKLGSTWQKVGGKSTISDNFVRAGDNIKLYIWPGSVQPTLWDDYLIMDGEITKFSYNVGENDLTLTVDGVNRTETLLSVLTPISQMKTGTGSDIAPRIIAAILDRINQFNSLKPPISYGFTTTTNKWTGSAGNIQYYNSAGGSFPSIAYHQNYKKAYELIEELSKPTYTGDDSVGNYIFYIKYSPSVAGSGYVNEFVWKNKSFVSSGSFVEGNDFGTYSIDYDLRDVVNAMIVSAGQDCYGHGKTTYVLNYDSMGKYGAKWKFYPLTSLIPDLIKTEKAIGSAVGSTYDSDNIPNILSTGSYMLHFDGRNSTTGTSTGSRKKVGNKTEYNNAMREEGKWQAQADAQKIVDILGSPRYSISFELNNPFVKGFTLGNLYDIQADSFGWENTSSNPMKKLRLYQVDYMINNEGLTTTLNLIEDEKSAGIV